MIIFGTSSAAPRVLIVGARSRPYPDEDAVRQAGIPVVEVPDAGHLMMGDNAPGFVSALLRAMPSDHRAPPGLWHAVR